MEELDHSGFVFARHQVEFETQASKAAKGIMMIIPVDVKIKRNFFEESQYKNKIQRSQANRVSDIFFCQRLRSSGANYELECFRQRRVVRRQLEDVQSRLGRNLISFPIMI